MEWQVKYEPLTKHMPWSVYVLFDDQKVYKTGFLTEDEARFWVSKQEKTAQHPHGAKKTNADKVDEASIESFPASDAPAWTKVSSKGHGENHGTRK